MMSGNGTINPRVRRWRNSSAGLQRSNALIGVVLICFGAVLLLKNFNILNFRSVWDFWPVFPIVWGAQAILKARSVFTYLVGGMAIALGSLKLLDNLDIIDVSSKLYGPLILICLGITFLVCNLKGEGASSMNTDDPKIHPMVVFGGVKQRVSSQAFEGGEMLAMFGGVEVDFRKARMKGQTATIEANALFGGVHLKIPETWTVELQGAGAFGGYEDKTIPPRPEDNLPMQKLILTGNAVFGGIVVEN